MSIPLEPDDLAAALAQVYVAIGPVYRKVARIVESDEVENGMSVGVRAVLDQLCREGELTVPGIAGRLELSRQFIQRMVNDASAAGYVDLVENPAHRRSRLVRLTSAGEAAITTVSAREHELMGRVGGDLTAGELEATLRVLHHMEDALDHITRSRRSSPDHESSRKPSS
jgi:DNA-binding MarR family transcriptional regulator